VLHAANQFSQTLTFLPHLIIIIVVVVVYSANGSRYSTLPYKQQIEKKAFSSNKTEKNNTQQTLRS